MADKMRFNQPRLIEFDKSEHMSMTGELVLGRPAATHSFFCAFAPCRRPILSAIPLAAGVNLIKWDPISLI